MNGRIYDPTLGRFLQADPFIQAPDYTQSYNRYAYVWNNPLNATDPSGYFLTGILKPVKKLGRNIIRGVSKVFGASFTNMVGNALSMFCGPFAPACAGAWNYEFARAHGASSSGALKAGLTAAATTYAFQQIGSQYSEIGDSNLFDVVDGVQDINNLHAFGGNLLTSGQIAGQIASHAIVGGVANSLNGGKFGHGFFSAGVTKGLGGAYLPGGTNLSTSEVIQGTVISAVIGGTASVITGGKFANGANTAVYQYLFNHAGSWLKDKLTSWHYEGRAKNNENLPSYKQAIAEGSKWKLLSVEQSIFHDDGVGKAELKFIHPDGREAVFNGDSLMLVTDPKFIGTYNYVNPAPVPRLWYDIGGWSIYATKGFGHAVLDVIPYCFGGNIRGQGWSC